jgi:dehydrogenase/reductase SDR family member 7B
MMRFHDRTVWITGASSGIGASLAAAFQREGAKVIASARREDRLRALAADCTAGPHPIEVAALDVTDAAARAAAAARLLARPGGVDILVNNAGIGQRSRVVDTDMAVYRRLMEVDFFAAVALTRLVLPSMLARGSGRIVAVTSVIGKYGTPMRSGYAAAKHAMHGFFDSLRAEVAVYGVSVTLVVPGSVDTDISRHALRGDGSRYDRRDQFLAAGRKPDDCAAATLDAIHRNRNEVLFADGVAWRLAMLKRFLPRACARAVQFKTRRG